MIKSKVLLAMSGGVDSSVSAVLLKQQNFDVIGITFYLKGESNNPFHHSDKNLTDAIIISNKLHIPHFIIDLRHKFNNLVVEYFINSYLSGMTPNPCTHCNPIIKWSTLLKLANEFECDYIATGHYADIQKYNNQYSIILPTDSTKDQSYFLWKLDNHYLKRTLFPLGQLRKEEVKKMAGENGLIDLSVKRESYNICFIPGNNYRNFIAEKLKAEDFLKYNGVFVLENGKIAGNHTGVYNYTIGQKARISDSKGSSLYVKEINPENYTITIGVKDAIYHKTALLNQFRIAENIIQNQEIELLAKYNHQSPFISCKVSIWGQYLKVVFERPIYALSPGQSVALYSDNRLVGGGIVCKTLDE